jgi:hypothetical protein
MDSVMDMVTEQHASVDQSAGHQIGEEANTNWNVLYGYTDM